MANPNDKERFPDLVNSYKLAYRSREDITNMPPAVLVVGSQNVLTNISDRVQIRQGYKMDGAKDTSLSSIVTSFDWNSKGNSSIHMRAGFLTSAANDGKLQFRYQSGTTVTWTTLLSSLTTVSYNYTTFWDTTELIRLCLFVNGTSNIFEWNGAYDTVTSVTANTIIVTNTIATTGFYSTRDRVVTINGVDYTYTGITSNTFTGVTPNPTGVVNAGDIAFQKVVTTANSGFSSGPPATFPNGLISTLNNQIFIGSLTSSTMYMSKVNSFIDYSFTAGARLPGDGATATLDDNLVAFVPQEDIMYMSAGKNFWYKTSLVQQATFDGTKALTTETFTVKLLKTNPRQGAQSQAMVAKMKNNVIMITFEPTFDTLGLIENINGSPQTDNISDSIKLDFDTYDFTGGSVFYWKYYLLVAIPAEGIVRIYNISTSGWEAPQILPITKFYTVDGELYGHSSSSSESYELFSGYSDRATATASGNPIKAVANFSFQNYGSRTYLKNSNEFYIEGYINANTTLNCFINYELDGCRTTQSFQVLGTDTQVVCIPSDSSSLGKQSLGKNPLGSSLSSSLTGLPPKFRVIKTFTRVNFYECQFSFTIFGADQRFELLAFGLNAQASSTVSSAISQ